MSNVTLLRFLGALAAAVLSGCSTTPRDLTTTQFSANRATLIEIDPADLPADWKALPVKEATKGKDWSVALVNMSDLCITLARTKDSNTTTYTKWFPVPTTCRTCNLRTYSDCFNAGKYKLMYLTQCIEQPFDIQISATPDASRTTQGSEFERMAPKCSETGAVVGIE